MPPAKNTPDRLTRTAVAERALRIGDTEGLDAITIRRLAQELGVTPMALYWHFKNKDELLQGITDHVLAGVSPDGGAAGPWPVQLRAMLEALVRAMRAHPCLPELMHATDVKVVESFTRATEAALGLLTAAGFNLQEAYWVATYLMYSALGLVSAQPGWPVSVQPDQADEWLRRSRIRMESLPVERFPHMVALADCYRTQPDLDRYFAFGIDLVMGAVEKMAAERPVTSQ
ncbi:TetR/AcrR family transcriptional regulator [Dactylosporangium sp. CA-092794]|uniref:TetR/AcrR family transcriptional regulator n=1 Tax=Dactylosporangium sp. CA-092794 TaxID=3239929 RepID=UPI003D946756